MATFPRPIHFAQQIIQSLVVAGDVVIDATLGNGHDAVFLAKLVGEKGLVIGFDVQQEAVDSATERMKENGVHHFEFHLNGHESMTECIASGHLPVKAVMFNLGYLPHADKSVITTMETTIPALNASLELLDVGGLLSIMCYPGHEGGDVESNAVSQWAQSLPREHFRVVHYGLHNAPNNPPFLLLVEKIC